MTRTSNRPRAGRGYWIGFRTAYQPLAFRPTPIVFRADLFPVKTTGPSGLHASGRTPKSENPIQYPLARSVRWLVQGQPNQANERKVFAMRLKKFRKVLSELYSLRLECLGDQLVENWEVEDFADLFNALEEARLCITAAMDLVVENHVPEEPVLDPRDDSDVLLRREDLR